MTRWPTKQGSEFTIISNEQNVINERRCFFFPASAADSLKRGRCISFLVMERIFLASSMQSVSTAPLLSGAERGREL